MSIIRAIKHRLGLSVTPANNFVLDASADNGTMKLARESGQDIMTVDAAGKVAFPQLETLLSNPGYARMPNGLLIQWGMFNTVVGGATVNFPIPFNTILAITATHSNGASPGTVTAVGIGTRNSTQFTVFTNPNVATNVGWIAIGY
jgi:hypothetical protein